MARTNIATPGFLDRLGDRVVVSDRSGGDLEVLRLRPELTGDAAFESCLKARSEQLTAFQHRSVSRVRGVSRLPAPDGRLAVVSDVAKGWRLSEVLQAAEHENVLVHTSAVLFMLRQVASAVAALQAVGPDVIHGALGLERVVLSPGGRVVVVEYVLGSALAHLPALSADRLWKDLRIAVPEADAERWGAHTDVLQLGIIALSLIHNRQLRRDEYPARLTELLDTATESRLTGERQPIGASLRRWLEQALGLAPGSGRWTMEDAQRGLDWIVSKEGGYFSTPVGLEPLLQSVDRFFTLGEDAADAEAAPAPAKAPEAESRLPQASSLTVTAAVRVAAPAPTPVAPAARPAVKPTPAPAPAPEKVTPPPAAVVEATPPLASRVAEAAAAPAPSRDAAQAAARVLTLVQPPRPSSTASDSGAEVAPVADMLSDDRPASTRRSGWNNEAWMSRSTDRQPAGARSLATSSSTTVRLAKSGAATAPVLRDEISPVADREEPVTAHAPQPRKEVEPSVAGGHAVASDHVSRPVSRPAPERRAAAPHQDSPVTAPSSASSRSLFGSADSDDHERADVEQPSGGGRGKWLAAAALVILCTAGVGAWWLLKPSPSAATAGGNGTSAAAPSAAAVAPNPAPTAPAAAATPTSESGAPTAANASADAESATGSVRVVSAVPVSVSEKGQALGTSAAALTLAAGRHSLDLANEEVGYHATHVVEVRAGKTARIQVALPRGSVNINATPWAEVLVDGQRIGETPLGNVQLTVGAHEVRFRHPQLGEQVRSVVVTTGAPARLSVDMKQ